MEQLFLLVCLWVLSGCQWLAGLLLAQIPVPNWAEPGDSQQKGPEACGKLCSDSFAKVVSENGHEAISCGWFVEVGERQGNLFLKVVYTGLKMMFSQLPFQSHQKPCTEGDKKWGAIYSVHRGTFPGHSRYFCLGAKTFSFKIMKHHHLLLGDFAVLVIWAACICVCVCKLLWKMHIIYLFWRGS